MATSRKKKKSVTKRKSAMKVLVTGGAGYKGVLLVASLLDAGHEVTLLDNFMYGYESVLHLVNNSRLSIVKEDIRNLNKKHVAGFDVVYHLAGISGYPACEANPHSAKLINVDASRRLGKCLSKNQMLIYASTTSFYGKSGGVCNEESEVEPVSLYGITKYQAEQILLERDNTISLRFATLFGVSPRMRVDLLTNDFVYKGVVDRCLVLFESQTKRTFLHIADAIRAYVFSLGHLDTMKGGVYNVGHDTLNFSKMDIAKAVHAVTGCKIIDSDMKDFDTRNFVISFEKIRKLGFEPKHTLKEGVAEMVKLYKFYRPFSAYRII